MSPEEYLAKVLNDKEYVEKVGEYTKAYLEIEKSIPHGFRINTMRKVSKLLKLQEELLYRKIDIQVEAIKRGENNG